jgi:hypothetical protein
MIDKSIARQLAEQEQAVSEEAPVEASFQPPAPSIERNSDVDNDLNSADVAFRDNEEANGCQFVANAIGGAASGASEDQAQQLKSYASRCNLRY